MKRTMIHKKRVLLYVLCASLILCLFETMPKISVRAADNTDNRPELIINVLALEAGGDCTIIQYGDTQILIDAGDTPDKNLDQIEEIMLECMGEKDTIWDYFIFSHPDKDHIGCARKILQFVDGYMWRVGTIVDYDFEGIPEDFYTATAKNYHTYRDQYIEERNTDYFSASELNENNMYKTFVLDEHCTMTILYNYFDHLDTYKSSSSKDEGQHNNISVCVLIKYDNQKVLFTGDLEQRGEERLLAAHTDLLENITLFKASHHGSENANSDEFINTIRPCYVSITNNDHAHISDRGINAFLQYTDFIYPSYVEYNDNDYLLYGTVKYILDGNQVIVYPENNSDCQSIRDAIILTENNATCWFEAKLNDPTAQISDELKIYAFEEDSSAFNCSLIKYGHLDILIDCGSNNKKSNTFVDELKKYVVDGILEYVVVTHFHDFNISQLVGNSTQNTGVFSNFRIETIIDTAETDLSSSNPNEYYSRYLSAIKELGIPHIQIRAQDTRTISCSENLSLSFIGCASSVTVDNDENNYSLSIVVSFYEDKMLFVGDMSNYEYLTRKHSSDIQNANYLRLSNSAVSIEKQKGFEEFLLQVKPEYIVIGSPINYRLSNGKLFMGTMDQNDLRNLMIENDLGEIYCCGCITDRNEYESINGTLIYTSGNTLPDIRMLSSKCSIPKTL